MVALILAALVVPLLFVIVMALAVPFRCTVRGGYARAGYGTLRISWPVRALRLEYTFGRNRLAARAGGLTKHIRFPEKRAQKAKPAPRADTDGRRHPRSMPDILPYLPLLLGLMKRLVAALRIRVSGRLSAGTGDPAATGLLYGMLCAATAGCGSVMVFPDFTRASFSCCGELGMRLPLGRLLLIAAGTALSRRGRAALRHLMKGRKPCNSSRRSSATC